MPSRPAAAPTPPPPPPPPPFEWLGGAPCLDFTNTVSWGRQGRSEERLVSYAALLDWAAQAGLLANRTAVGAAARRAPAEAQAVLGEALALRELLHALFGRIAAGERPTDAQLAGLNGRLADTLGALIVVPGETRAFDWGWRSEDLHSPLRPVVWSAAELLRSAETIKQCGNPDCGWLFVDRSRRGNRRWCDMRECGSRAKARRYYRRKKAAKKPATRG